MLNFKSVNIGTENPQKLAKFYEKIFGNKPDVEMGTSYGWLVGTTFLSIMEHSEVKGKACEPQRIILNFETAEVKEEFARIKALGAEVVKEPYAMGGGDKFWVATFADPDGNFFQLVSPWNQDQK